MNRIPEECVCRILQMQERFGNVACVNKTWQAVILSIKQEVVCVLRVGFLSIHDATRTADTPWELLLAPPRALDGPYDPDFSSSTNTSRCESPHWFY